MNSYIPIIGRSWRELIIREKMVRKGSDKSRSQCMETGCEKPPEVECIWADGRARAWHCQKHHEAWAQSDTGEGLPKAIVKQRKVPNGVVGDKYNEYPEAKKVSHFGFGVRNSFETKLNVDRLLALYRQASAADGKKTGYRDSVGLFIPLPKDLAEKFPSLAPTDNSPPHVTFLFIGNVSPEQDEILLKTIHKVFSSGISTIKAKLAGLDYFIHPDKDRRVAHCPVVFNQGLSEIRSRLRSALEDVGIQVEDSFPVYRPHVTLEYLPDTKATYEGPIPSGTWEFDEIEIWGLPQEHRVSFRSGKTAEKIPGGIGDKKKPSDFDPEQLAKGIKVEMEHTDDKSLAQDIAIDHLTEDSSYYDKLETIEKHASKYDHINFKPPASVANAAKKGLEYRKKQKGDKAGLTPSEAAKEGIGSGVQRATNLKNRDKVSPKVIKQMVAFFSRHEKNKSIAPEHKNEPWKDKGYVSWLLWGGDPGKTWAEKVQKQMEAADKKSKTAFDDKGYLKTAFVAVDGWDPEGNHQVTLWPDTLDEEGIIHHTIRPAFERAGYAAERVTRDFDDVIGVSFKGTRLSADGLVQAYKSRLASRQVKRAGYFSPGDIILYGKYKNKKGKVVAVGRDDKGNPTIEIEQIPNPTGRKKNKTLSVLKVWHADPEKRAQDDGTSQFEELMQQEVGPSPAIQDSVTQLVARYLNAKYKAKHEDKDGNVHYEYSEKQVQHRNREKAKRVEGLKKAMPKLRAKVKRDLKSGDPKTKLTALAVALMDETYERVGNDNSADEGHFGVTGWQTGHVSFGNSTATIKYTGKSGVRQEKKISNQALVSALRDAVGDKGGKEKIFEYECEKGDTCVSPADVNNYLGDFGITAKDIRGYHANDEMLSKLKAIRDKGPTLPHSRKEKDEILKKEFEEALKETAELVGHEPSTLKSDYLVPGLKDSYLHDGTVMESFTKKATKDDSEKEDESARGLVRREPQKKPPRDDLRRRRVKNDDDPDLKKPNATNDPDLSHNYKGRNAKSRKLTPVDTGNGFMGGTFYRMNVRDDRFVHFTPASRALEVLRSKKLLMNPPYKKFGIDAVTAVSLVYGRFAPKTQTTHIKGDEELVGVVFSTNAVPDVGYVEEVIWKRDVPLSKVQIVPARRAISMLGSTPEHIDANDQVFYEGSGHLRKLNDLSSKAAALAFQYLKVAEEWWEGKKFPHKTDDGTTTQVGWKSLTPEEQSKYQKKHEKKLKEEGKDKKKPKDEKTKEEGKDEEEESDPGNPELTPERLAEDPRSANFLWQAAKGTSKNEKGEEVELTAKELADLYEATSSARITEETAQKILDLAKEVGGSSTLADALEAQTKKAIDETLSKAGLSREDIGDRLKGMSPEDKRTMVQAMKETEDKYLENPVSSDIAAKLAEEHNSDLKKDKLPKDPAELGKYLAERSYTKHVILNPMMVGGRAVSDSDKSPEELKERGVAAFETYRDLEPEARNRAVNEVVNRLGEVDTDSHEAKELNAILDGLALAGALRGENTTGRPSPSTLFTEVAKSLERQGEAHVLLESVDQNSTSGRKALRKGFEGMSNEQLISTVTGTPLLEALGERLRNAKTPEGVAGIRQMMINLATDDIQFVDPMIHDGLKASGKEEKAKDPKARANIRKEIHNSALGAIQVPENLDKDSRKRLRMGVLQWALGRVKKLLGNQKSMAVTQVEEAVQADEPDILNVPAAKPVAKPVQKDRKSKKGTQSGAYSSKQLSEGPFPFFGKGKNEPESPRPFRRNMMSEAKLLTKKGAAQMADHAGRLAHVLEHNWKALGIPSHKHAMDLAYRLDLFAETVEQTAQTNERRVAAAREKQAELTVGEGTIKDDSGAKLQGGLPEQDNQSSVPNGYDPADIGKIKPPTVQEPDEPYMDAFVQDEFHQLADLQQSGGFSNAKVAINKAVEALTEVAQSL